MQTSTSVNDYLRDHIRTVPDWPAPGVQFRDITPLLQDPKVFRIMTDAFVHRYMDPKLRPDVVAGLDARGFILGAVIAHELNVGFVPIRKKGKLPFTTVEETYELEYGSATVELHTDAVKSGDRVLLIDDLIANGQTDAEHVAASALADEVADALAAAEGGTELHLEAFHAGIASSGDAGEMQRLGVIGQLLAGGVGDLAATAADEIGDGDAEAAFTIEAAVMIDDADLRVVLRDDERVRKDGRMVADDPVEDFDRLFDDDVLRHDKHGACFDMRQMQRGEFVRAESLLTLHEMLLQGRFVRFEGIFKADARHAGRKTARVGLDKRVVHEDEACRAFLEAFGGCERGFGLLGRWCLGRSVVGEFDLLRVRVAPVFVFQAGKRQRLEFGPRGSGTGCEPAWSVGTARWSEGEEAGGGGGRSGRH